MGKNKAAFGIYSTTDQLRAGVSALESAGFRTTDISVLYPESLGTKELATEKHSKAPEGATAGAVTGAVVGGGLAWLAAAGTIAIPGIGPLLVAGPLVAALAGAGAGGAAGGLIGALAGMGIPEFEAKRYAGRLKDGGILMSVHCDDSDWADKAKDVLEATGAVDVASTTEAKADYQP
ncbi:MAG TPA: hypothetical protein VE967_18465 [Gemmatimonadaceae bacterium]|nr:hypothetical protein [Gemmatimonadaceae bacterium]